MKPTFRSERGAVGNDLFIRLPDLTGYPSTTMTADASAGAASLSTQDASPLTVNQYIVVGMPGDPESEIQQVSAVTSGKTIALQGTVTFPHSNASPVAFIPFNQVRIERSTDSGSTYSTLETVTLRMGNPEFYYQHIGGAATDFYRVRFVNSTSSNTSDPSDGLIATGYGQDTVFSVKRRAVEASGMKMTDVYRPNALVSDVFLNEALFEGRRIVHNRLKRWSFRQQFDSVIQNVTSGTNSFALPTDLQDRNTSKNMHSLRIGTHRSEITFITKREWNKLQEGRKHTTLGAAIIGVGDTTVTLTDSSDFEESGAISIVDSGTEDQIDYTANAESTGILSGVTNISAAHVISLDVWQNPSYGLPRYFTIFEGRAYFDVPVSVDYHAENILMDYYKTVVTVDSDADTFDEPEYDMYVPYLKWRIRQARTQGVVTNDDPDAVEFTRRVEQLVFNELADHPIQFVPSLPMREDDVM